MCWLPAYPIAFGIAEEDIPIMKIVSKDTYDGKFDCSAAYRHNGYKLNKTYTTTLPKSDSTISVDKNITDIQFGYHSYSPKKVYLDQKSPTISDNIYRVKSTCEGKALDWWNSWDYVVVEGIIPRGSYYYLNDRGEYVSSSIKLKNLMSFEQYIEKQENLIR